MKSLWLNKRNNKNLIVFFNGWGMNETIVSHLDCNCNDVLMFCDYRKLDIENFDFSRYKNKFLVAWSMGVYITNLFYDKLKYFNKKIAVNGTFYPVDNNYGIIEKIYNLTVNNFNETSCKKFVQRMFINKELLFNRTIQELKDELVSIKQYTKAPLQKILNYDKVIISLKDKIIPTKNQIHFWKDKDVIIENIDCGHYPFDVFSNWNKIIK